MAETARQRVADAAAMTLGASQAISRTALPPGAWNGDSASASRFLKLFIERGMYPALLEPGRSGADYVKIENPV